MKAKIVTAFYTDISGHPYYGHGDISRHERYLHSLRVLNNMENEIICYCNDSQYNLLEEYIKNFNLTYVTLKISNLNDSKYTQRMVKIKDETNDFKFYHESDWNKFFLLDKEYDENYDFIYWIDVGLSHHGLFPKRYNPYSDKATGFSADYYTYSFTNLFNNKLIYALNNFVGDKLISLNNTLFFHNMSYLSNVLEIEQLNYDSLTVGGILGGNILHLKWFINEFYSIGEKILNKNVIINHEAIASYIRHINPNNFESFKFDTWYHDDIDFMTEDMKNNLTHFCHFFDKILKK
jgi:hypothetical protein